MKQKEVFKKIGGIIQELNDQYEYLKTVEDDLNDLELELFVSNAHFLTDHIEILCKLNLQNKVRKPALVAKPEKPEKIEKQETSFHQKFFEPVVQQMKQGALNTEDDTAKINPQPKTVEIEIVKPADEAIKLPESEEPAPRIDLSTNDFSESAPVVYQEPETIRHELILDESDNWEDEEEEAEHEQASIREEETEEINDIPVVASEPDLFALTEDVAPISESPVNKPAEEPSILTFNQRMSAKLADKINARAEQTTIKPISDIKLAITLNDKLLYVKDLFNGYNLAYSEAIEILNRFSTFEEAQRFLKTNYVTKNNWESKPATTEKFYALLKRRYA
eukprot:gene3797-3844_t